MIEDVARPEGIPWPWLLGAFVTVVGALAAAIRLLYSHGLASSSRELNAMETILKDERAARREETAAFVSAMREVSKDHKEEMHTVLAALEKRERRER